MTENGAAARLEVAFGELEVIKERDRPLSTDEKAEIARTVKALLTIAQAVPSPHHLPDAYRDVGVTASRAELAKLAKAADWLWKCLNTLHQPAIIALADQGFLRHGLDPQLLRKLASAAKRASEANFDETPKVGRPPDTRAQVVTRLVVKVFDLLAREVAGRLGYDPDRGRRGLAWLLETVFHEIEIEANHRSMLVAVRSEKDSEGGGDNSSARRHRSADHRLPEDRADEARQPTGRP